MRVSRLLTALLALVLAASVPVVAPAGAAPGPSGPGAGGSPALRAGTDPVTGDPVTVTSRVVKRSGRAGKGKGLFLVGDVSSKRGPVIIQRATRCDRRKNTCNFTFYRRKRLTDGRYDAKIAAPPTLRGWMWRARVGDAVSDSWVTCTKTARQVRRDKDCQIPFKKPRRG